MIRIPPNSILKKWLWAKMRARAMSRLVALALFVALISGRLGQFLRLGLQQLVERFLYAASYQLLKLPLDYFLV